MSCNNTIVYPSSLTNHLLNSTTTLNLLYFASLKTGFAVSPQPRAIFLGIFVFLTYLEPLHWRDPARSVPKL